MRGRLHPQTPFISEARQSLVQTKQILCIGLAEHKVLGQGGGGAGSWAEGWQTKPMLDVTALQEKKKKANSCGFEIKNIRDNPGGGLGNSVQACFACIRH